MVLETIDTTNLALFDQLLTAGSPPKGSSSGALVSPLSVSSASGAAGGDGGAPKLAAESRDSSIAPCDSIRNYAEDLMASRSGGRFTSGSGSGSVRSERDAAPARGSDDAAGAPPAPPAADAPPSEAIFAAAGSDERERAPTPTGPEEVSMQLTDSVEVVAVVTAEEVEAAEGAAEEGKAPIKEKADKEAEPIVESSEKKTAEAPVEPKDEDAAKEEEVKPATEEEKEEEKEDKPDEEEAAAIKPSAEAAVEVEDEAAAEGAEKSPAAEESAGPSEQEQQAAASTPSKKKFGLKKLTKPSLPKAPSVSLPKGGPSSPRALARGLSKPKSIPSIRLGKPSIGKWSSPKKEEEDRKRRAALAAVPSADDDDGVGLKRLSPGMVHSAGANPFQTSNLLATKLEQMTETSAGGDADEGEETMDTIDLNEDSVEEKKETEEAAPATPMSPPAVESKQSCSAFFVGPNEESSSPEKGEAGEPKEQALQSTKEEEADEGKDEEGDDEASVPEVQTKNAQVTELVAVEKAPSSEVAKESPVPVTVGTLTRPKLADDAASTSSSAKLAKGSVPVTVGALTRPKTASDTESCSASASAATHRMPAQCHEHVPAAASIFETLLKKAEECFGDVTNMCGPSSKVVEKTDEEKAQESKAMDNKEYDVLSVVTNDAAAADNKTSNAEAPPALDTDDIADSPTTAEAENFQSPLSVATEKMSRFAGDVKASESFRTLAGSVDKIAKTASRCTTPVEGKIDSVIATVRLDETVTEEESEPQDDAPAAVTTEDVASTLITEVAKEAEEEGVEVDKDDVADGEAKKNKKKSKGKFGFRRPNAAPKETVPKEKAPASSLKMFSKRRFKKQPVKET